LEIAIILGIILLLIVISVLVGRRRS
jgi:hypothetical protein